MTLSSAPSVSMQVAFGGEKPAIDEVEDQVENLDHGVCGRTKTPRPWSDENGTSQRRVVTEEELGEKLDKMYDEMEVALNDLRVREHDGASGASSFKENPKRSSGMWLLPAPNRRRMSQTESAKDRCSAELKSGVESKKMSEFEAFSRRDVVLDEKEQRIFRLWDDNLNEEDLDVCVRWTRAMASLYKSAWARKMIPTQARVARIRQDLLDMENFVKTGELREAVTQDVLTFSTMWTVRKEMLAGGKVSFTAPYKQIGIQHESAWTCFCGEPISQKIGRCAECAWKKSEKDRLRKHMRSQCGKFRWFPTVEKPQKNAMTSLMVLQTVEQWARTRQLKQLPETEHGRARLQYLSDQMLLVCREKRALMHLIRNVPSCLIGPHYGYGKFLSFLTHKTSMRVAEVTLESGNPNHSAYSQKQLKKQEKFMREKAKEELLKAVKSSHPLHDRRKKWKKSVEKSRAAARDEKLKVVDVTLEAGELEVIQEALGHLFSTTVGIATCAEHFIPAMIQAYKDGDVMKFSRQIVYCLERLLQVKGALDFALGEKQQFSLVAPVMASVVIEQLAAGKMRIVHSGDLYYYTGIGTTFSSETFYAVPGVEVTEKNGQCQCCKIPLHGGECPKCSVPLTEPVAKWYCSEYGVDPEELAEIDTEDYNAHVAYLGAHFPDFCKFGGLVVPKRSIMENVLEVVKNGATELVAVGTRQSWRERLAAEAKNTRDRTHPEEGVFSSSEREDIKKKNEEFFGSDSEDDEDLGTLEEAAAILAARVEAKRRKAVDPVEDPEGFSQAVQAGLAATKKREEDEFTDTSEEKADLGQDDTFPVPGPLFPAKTVTFENKVIHKMDKSVLEPVQPFMKKLMEFSNFDLTEWRESELVHSISGKLAVSFLVPFLSMLGMKHEIAVLQQWRNAGFGEKQQQDFLSSFVELLQFVGEALTGKVTKREVTIFEKWVEDTKILIEVASTQSGIATFKPKKYEGTEFEDRIPSSQRHSEFIREANLLLIQGKKMAEVMPRNSPSLISMGSMFAQLSSAIGKVSTSSKTLRRRMAPFVIHAWGGTNHRKSGMITTMATPACRIMGGDPTDTWNAHNTDFADGYVGQSVIVFDDLNQLKVVDPLASANVLLLELCQNIPFIANMAALEEKGRVTMEPSVIVVTSNAYDANTAGQFTCPEAALRRLRFVVEFDRGVTTINGKTGTFKKWRAYVREPGPGNTIVNELMLNWTYNWGDVDAWLETRAREWFILQASVLRDWETRAIPTYIEEFGAALDTKLADTETLVIHGQKMNRKDALKLYFELKKHISDSKHAQRVADLLNSERAMFAYEGQIWLPRKLVNAVLCLTRCDWRLGEHVEWVPCKDVSWLLSPCFTHLGFVASQLLFVIGHNAGIAWMGAPVALINLAWAAFVAFVETKTPTGYRIDDWFAYGFGLSWKAMMLWAFGWFGFGGFLIHLAWDFAAWIPSGPQSMRRQAAFWRSAGDSLEQPRGIQWDSTLVVSMIAMGIAIKALWDWKHRKDVVSESAVLIRAHDAIDQRMGVTQNSMTPKYPMRMPATNYAYVPTGAQGRFDKIRAATHNIKVATPDKWVNGVAILVGNTLITCSHNVPRNVVSYTIDDVVYNITDENVQRIRDFCFIRMPKTMKKISIDKSYLAPPKEGWQDMKLFSSRENRHYRIRVKRERLVGKTEVQSELFDATYQISEVVSGPDITVGGVSGSPIYYEDEKMLYVVGIHSGRVNDTGEGVITFIDADMLRAYEEYVSVLYGPSISQKTALTFDGVKTVTLQALHEKSILNHVDSPAIEVLGTVAPRGRPMRSNLRKTKLAPFVEEKHPPVRDFVIPVFDPFLRDTGEWVSPMLVGLSQIGDRTIITKQGFLKACQQYIAERLVQTQQFPLGDAYGMHAVLNGIPGILKSLEWSTAAGAGFPGQKALYREGAPGAYLVTDKVLQSVNAYLDMLDAGVAPTFCFRASLKDELIKESKLKDGRIRVFFGSSLPMVIVFRLVFGHCFTWMHNNRLVHPWKIGVNATSKEWHHIVEWLKEFPRFFDSDISAFDKTCGLLHHGVEIMVEVMRLSGQPAHLVQRAQLLTASISTYFLEVEGSVALVDSATPSGVSGTTDFNCLVELLVEVLSYASAFCDLESIPLTAQSFRTCMHNFDFFEHVHLINYGDDNLKSISPKVDFWSDAKIVKGFAECGFKLTHASDKTLPPSSSTDLSQVAFLGRRMWWHEDMKQYTAPLNMTSIWRSLCAFDVSSPISEDDNRSRMFEDAQRAFFLWGRREHEDFLMWHAQLPEELRSTPKFKTYEELIADYESSDESFSVWTT